MALRDIRPQAAGVPWAVWYEQQIDRIFAEAREKRRSSGKPERAEPIAQEQQAIALRTRDMWLLDPSYKE